MHEMSQCFIGECLFYFHREKKRNSMVIVYRVSDLFVSQIKKSLFMYTLDLPSVKHNAANNCSVIKHKLNMNSL